MAIHFYLHDCDKKVDIAIASPETVIGRDSVLQCDDKRISRQHGIIKHGGEQPERTIQITSTHTNPIFLRTAGDDQVLNILTKDLTATLRHGEKFALLPDQYWFEVRFKDPAEVDESAVSSSSSPTEEAAATTAVAGGSSDGEFLRVRTMEEVNDAVAEQRVLPDWIGGGSGEKRKNGEESEAESTKRARCDEGDQAESTDEVPVAVKTDPDAAEASTSEQKSPSAEVPEKEVKKETADSTCSPPGRPSCQFGIGCYRHTVEHRTQFAHPNDSDYRRPTFPPAPADAPQCPYGVSCYRRNPQHFRDFQHPDSTTVAPAATNQQQVPGAGQQPNIGAGRRRRRRLARDIVIAAMANPDLFDSDDEEDDGEDFDADTDSDDYRPGADLDDDDDDDEEEEDDDEEDQLNFRVLTGNQNEE